MVGDLLSRSLPNVFRRWCALSICAVLMQGGIAQRRLLLPHEILCGHPVPSILPTFVVLPACLLSATKPTILLPLSSQNLSSQIYRRCEVGHRQSSCGICTGRFWDDWLAQSSFVESDAGQQGATWISFLAPGRRLGATPSAHAASRTSSGELGAAVRLLLLLMLLYFPESTAAGVRLVPLQ
jgi:hypothetical protein